MKTKIYFIENSFDYNGKLRYKWNFKDGIKDGPWEEYYENGFNDIEFDIYQPIASGMQSLYNVVVVAPSLRRLGEVFDALSAESWAQEAYSLVTSSRPSLVSDKAYLCEQVYSSL